MPHLLLQSITLLAFWLLAFAFITAIGFARIPFRTQNGVLTENKFNYFWYGLGKCILFLQLWNLFAPVNFFCWAILLPIALDGLREMIKARFFSSVKFPGWITVVLMLLVAVFLITSSLDNSFIYDTIVYHFYCINWANHYPSTPGAANLYIYLAVNQSYFLYAAFLNGLWGHYAGACASNGLLTIAICTEIICNTKACFSGKKKVDFLSAFQLLFLPICINAGVQNLSSPTPDVFVNVFTFKVLCDVIRCIEAKQITFQDIFLLAFYALFGMVMKLSFAGIGFGLLFMALYWLIKTKRWKAAQIWPSIGIYALLVLPWIVRGGIASGYLGFPLTLFPLPVDWLILKGNVINFADYIKGFARSHLHGPPAIEAAHNYSWVHDWIIRMLSTLGAVLPVCLCIGLIVWFRIRRTNTRKLNLFLIPVLITLAFWFFMAPDIRFAPFTFWALGLAPLAFLIAGFNYKWLKAMPVVIFICACAVMYKNRNLDMQPIGDVPKINNPGIFTTRSGLKINIVHNNPGEDHWEIGDCNIPCSVFPDSALTLRGKTITEGFRIERK
ncbi:hypothetical protein HQ865_24465 [Mucilaginibacter mali]|uniref:DUF8201 domain-containing protein n=1 Tax=Mucilaginibacter mali TaxID=2740462 RepID=A0A7D4UH65_9SPHI|nr:hypothetical protein [Mucilaginibacter mali]QKJ32776.1 hypothetical protein HQ865_24465 [Mucilaginibacter mali]